MRFNRSGANPVSQRPNRPCTRQLRWETRERTQGLRCGVSSRCNGNAPPHRIAPRPAHAGCAGGDAGVDHRYALFAPAALPCRGFFAFSNRAYTNSTNYSRLIGFLPERFYNGVAPRGCPRGCVLTAWHVEPREQKERSDGPRQHRRQHSQRGQGEEQSDEEGHYHCPDSKRHSVSPTSSHASPTAIVTYRVGSVFGFNFHNVRTGPSSL